MKKILVVAAHPDDEVLGCGGTIARHIAEGDDVFIAYLADGETSRETQISKEQLINSRYYAANKACEILGVKKNYFYNLPDNMLDSLPLLDVIKNIEDTICDILPDVIYTHHSGDLNIDHRICHQAVLTAARPIPGTTIKSIYTFEVPSSTEWSSPHIGGSFIPNHHVDITNFIEIKITALKEYEAEMRDYPHPRSLDAVKSLSNIRGISVGLEYAEAFMVVRSIY